MLTSILIFLVGLCIGSLLNVLIVRLPREGRLFGWPRCTRTGKPLALWELLRVIGWLIQRGHAANGRRLHWIYPLVELLSGLMLLRLYQLYGFSNGFYYLAFVCVVLIVTGAIDWLHRYIYTFVILGAALLAMIIAPFVGFYWPHVLLGALIAGVVFMLFFMLARAMFPGAGVPFGLGDVYLAIFIGAAVGIFNLASALFYGMVIAGIVSAIILVARRAGRSVPQYISYGTFLCLGVMLFIALGGMG